MSQPETVQAGLDDVGDAGALAEGSIPTEHTFRAAWKQPEDVDRILREATAGGYTINVCAGQSPLGDVKVDAQPQARDVIPADMEQLPFDDNTFDYALLDPPWNLNYFSRQKPLFEAIRVTKPDGVVFFNARWVGESRETAIEPPLIIRSDDAWGDISVIVAHRVDPDQQDLSHWGAGVDDVPTRPNPHRHVECHGCGEEVLDVDAVRSDHLGAGDGAPFCSGDCMQQTESALGERLTPVEPGESPFPAANAAAKGREERT